MYGSASVDIVDIMVDTVDIMVDIIDIIVDIVDTVDIIVDTVEIIVDVQVQCQPCSRSPFSVRASVTTSQCY